MDGLELIHLVLDMNILYVSQISELGIVLSEKSIAEGYILHFSSTYVSA